jgi:hypothetical protein
MGELKHGNNLKDEIFDFYQSWNKAIASHVNIDFIDTRTEFLARLNQITNQPLGQLTIDGEHLNREGTNLITELFINQLTSWKDLWNSSEVSASA